MSERSDLITWIRGELVGPSRALSAAVVMEFNGTEFSDSDPKRRGPLAWRSAEGECLEEILYYDRETPHRKYGIGLLHPVEAHQLQTNDPAVAAALAADNLGVDLQDDEIPPIKYKIEESEEEDVDDLGSDAIQDVFNISSPDIRHPSTLGISFCVSLDDGGKIIVRLPRNRHFSWQAKDDVPFPVNGRYEKCTRRWVDSHGADKESPMWRRRPALSQEIELTFDHSDLENETKIIRDLEMPEHSPVALRVEMFPRRIPGSSGLWLVTVVLKNSTHIHSSRDVKEAILYQSYFEVAVDQGSIEKYPESQRPFSKLDADEQSLALLYRESATWGIGHGCAAGWDAQPNQRPSYVFADIMPAVELPSMTPEIRDDQGHLIQLSMRSLASLPDTGDGLAWQSLEGLATEYGKWIQIRRFDADSLPTDLKSVATRHLDACGVCLSRIRTGIKLLREDSRIRQAFKLANLAMILQQISTKKLHPRPLQWDVTSKLVNPEGHHQSPWEIFNRNEEGASVGTWRAFQIAFILMSIQGVAFGESSDREIVDLIWFPTGGGKTEAYLGATAFYLFHERLLMTSGDELQRDGTNVLMRYTLRMLTTQQFQRAASLICSMEFLRRNPALHGLGAISGRRFSLGLWIGQAGSPNKIENARAELNRFQREKSDEGNPLVLTECPWCRSGIGRYDGPKPAVTPRISDRDWNLKRVRGISDTGADGPLLHCPDADCPFGTESHQSWLPIEVIDERIFKYPPSLVIATADKFAMVAYRPEAGALFGRIKKDGKRRSVFSPPGLIIQDELHLIAGPLGTMYGLYEGIFERLCSRPIGENGWIKPKLIASTATIRGAAEQVKGLYARDQLHLFPSPGLLMGDSFFGTYARHEDNTLRNGRMYLGIHANDYGSILTAQVRTFASALFRPFAFSNDRRDPWWTLLVFYNSIRELGMAKTLFDSDIRSRLWFMFNRENIPLLDRRNLRGSPEELTSRLSQTDIVGMLEKLSTEYAHVGNKSLDACLASNIIEVGIDIERLSLMGVVGQPKTTAQYIQVTGRVGRKWWERAGLIMTIYNPSNSRDRSHFEQFHSYHRRLYERVEPTSVTPFALAAIQRALPGALIAWARQHVEDQVYNYENFKSSVEDGYELLRIRCKEIQAPEDIERSLKELERLHDELLHKWALNPAEWEEFPPSVDGEYLMLWPGQYATRLQKDRGVVVPSSMRQVDGSAELNITQGYALDN